MSKNLKNEELNEIEEIIEEVEAEEKKGILVKAKDAVTSDKAKKVAKTIGLAVGAALIGVIGFAAGKASSTNEEYIDDIDISENNDVDVKEF